MRFRTEEEADSFSQALAAHKRLPYTVGPPTEEQDFCLATGSLAAIQPRRDDATLVCDEEIAGAQVAVEIVKDGVLDAPIVAAQHQQARRVARLDGCLR